MRCAICLAGNIKYKMCCNTHVHKKCQKLWGETCIICRKKIPIVTDKKYTYTPPEPELTRAELREQLAIMQEIQRRNEREHGDIEISIEQGTVRRLTSYFENLF